MIDLGSTIVAALNGNAELTTALGVSKAYRLKPPEGVLSPYLTVTEELNEDLEYADNQAVSVSLIHQIDICFQEYDFVKMMAAAAAAEVEMKALGFKKINYREFYDVDTGFYHKVLRYRIVKNVD